MSLDPFKAVHLPDPLQKPILTVEEGGALFGLGRSSSYTEAARFLATDGAKGLPVLKFGRRLMCPTAKLLRLLGLDAAAARTDAPKGAGTDLVSTTTLTRGSGCGTS